MTNRIIELAKQAGINFFGYCLEADYVRVSELQRFAELVRNEVLEEAAEACERLPLKSAKACAEVIRLEKS